MMKHVPAFTALPGGGVGWSHAYDRFRVKVIVPPPQPLSGIVNFGFKAPYLLVFEEAELSLDGALAFAVERGLYDFARDFSASVVFVFPTCEGGWDAADEELFVDLVAESRVNQYYRNGVAMEHARHTHVWSGNFILGAIFRTFLYGCGKSADFIARRCLKTLHGLYLWGPGEITPTAAVLENLSVMPDLPRRDFPIVSVANSDAVNAAFRAQCDHLLILPGRDDRACREFLTPFKRWCGNLEIDTTMDEEGMVEEPGFVSVKTSPDNRGDDSGTQHHRVGYMAYWRKDLTDAGKLPLVLGFHGGGDSAFHLAYVSGWWRIARKYGFLFVALEDHLNSTALETVEIIERLKERYPIDEKRVYGIGFSMGGCKSWDVFEQCPQAFAAIAPMCATYDVGVNVYGEPVTGPINRDHPLPVFYAGGEASPLAELPFQAQKCCERMAYVFEVNRVKKPYNASFSDQSDWENPVWGVEGDVVERFDDPSRGSVLTVHTFYSEDGVARTALASVSGQQHECREHTCEHAWRFMSRFTLE